MADSKTLAQALVEAQANMDAPKKTAENPHFKSRFAPLDELLNVAKPALNAVGIAISQPLVTTDDGRIGVKTVLIGHGEEMDLGTLSLLAPGDPQKVGSLLTYLRRYSLAAALGLAAEDDDDGNAASAPKTAGNAAPAASEGSSSAYASDKQQKLIHVLAKKAGYDEAALKGMLKVRFKTDDLAKLRKGDASKVIDGLNEAIEQAEKEPPVEDQLEALGAVEQDLSELPEVPF